MISHGNIVADINKGKILDSVGLHLLRQVIRIAQHLLRLGGAQRRKAMVYLVKTSMSEVGSCCFYLHLLPPSLSPIPVWKPP